MVGEPFQGFDPDQDSVNVGCVEFRLFDIGWVGGGEVRSLVG